MPKFQHFIITRFFVRFSDKQKDIDFIESGGGAWLEDRLKLFRQFCLPSVLNQSNPDFRWLVYFDHATPPAFLDKMKVLLTEHPFASLVLCTTFSPETIKNAISAQVDADTDWILTTRLDNDDAIHHDFVKILHDNIKFDKPRFLNFPIGIIYHNSMTYLYRHDSNAFISRIEPLEECLTVLCGPHTELHRFGEIRQLPPTVGFMQVAHANTISNKPRGLRVHKLLALRGFEALDLPPLANDERDLDIVLSNVTASPLWYLRDAGVNVLKAARRLLRR